MTTHDKTQYQSDQDRIRSRELSLTSSKPPIKVPGYSIEQFLGAGAYGEVWSGTEKKTGRRVAIKFYTRRTSDDVTLLAGEVEKLVALAADRYVVQLVDVDWQAEPPYFVMDYFEAGSLDELLRQETSLPTAAAEDLFREIATGMMSLHGKGIFHCDLKPGNVLLDQHGKPRLADFGQARLKTEKASSLGTLFFMAPEQADLNAAPAVKWDVYALGALFYCMLVGQPPYYSRELADRIDAAGSVEERLAEYKRALGSADTPTEHRTVKGVDRLLADVVDRAIEADPKKRFDSVQSMMFAMRQRELAIARRPLVVLGLLGPLMLLVVMSLFSWFAYRQAYADAESAVKVEAIDGNSFAARLAARSAAEKIDQYFRAVEELAQDPGFVDDFIRATRDSELGRLAGKLDDPNLNADPALESDRRDYRNNAARKQLQQHFDERIAMHPVCASWFANDIRGNQVASAFAVEPDTVTIARNYAYRTYFHGEKKDRRQQAGEVITYDVAPWGVDRKIIDHPHLSTVFLSKGTYTWKVAFSVPIRIKDDEGQPKIIGIVACTSEMGNFVDFENGKSQYAVLVDGRGGHEQSVILEHPVFDQLAVEKKKVPRKTVDLKLVSETGHFDDPIAEMPEGVTYRRKWIAAHQSVNSPRFAANQSSDDNRDDDESGLFVVVAEEYGSVIQPVNQLSARLIMLAAFAAVFFLCIALTMWLFVMRLLRDTNFRLARSFSGPGESSFNSHTIDDRNQA